MQVGTLDDYRALVISESYILIGLQDDPSVDAATAHQKGQLFRFGQNVMSWQLVSPRSHAAPVPRRTHDGLQTCATRSDRLTVSSTAYACLPYAPVALAIITTRLFEPSYFLAMSRR